MQTLHLSLTDLIAQCAQSDSGQLQVITVNERLSRHLNHALLKEVGHPVKGGVIQSLSQYLASRYQEHALGLNLPVLLNSNQSHQIWRQVIANARDHLDSGAQSALARRAQVAYEWVVRWQLSEADLDNAANTPEQQAFITWLKSFKVELAQRHCACEVDRLSTLQTHGVFEQSPVAQFLLVGFETLALDCQAWLNARKEAGTAVRLCRWPSLFAEEPQVNCHVCIDDEQERLMALDWAKKRYQQGLTASIVVPNLHEVRDYWVRDAQALLAPTVIYPGQAEVRPVFEITGGMPLVNAWPVQIALCIWELTEVHEPTEFFRLILSPYIAGSFTERDQRHQLVAKLKSLGAGRFDMASLSSYLSHTEHNCPILAKVLKDFCSLTVLKGKALGDHLVYAQAQLMAWGFPGQCDFNSEEHQMLVQFWQLFAGLAELDGFLAAPDGWLLEFERQLTSQVFQAEQVGDAPIKVMGLLESEAIPMEAMWLTTLTDRQLPESVRFDPLIGPQLQRERKMPFADPGEERLRSRASLARRTSQSVDLELSYPAEHNDLPMAPSPLLTEVFRVTFVPQQVPFAPWAEFDSIDNALEPVPEHQALPVTDVERASLKGGQGLIQSQGVCPFQSFARHRLKLKAPSAHAVFFNPQRQGELIHQVLADAWKNWVDQASLQKTSPQARHQEIEAITTQAVDTELKKNPLAKVLPLYRRCEIERIVQLVDAYLVLDSKREVGFEVIGIESALAVEIEGVKLSLRIDRIDRLANGETLVIDYKTGQVSTPLSLLQACFSEPQLPLYAVYAEAQAVAWGRVHIKGPSLQGLGASDIGEKKIPSIDVATKSAMGAWSELLAFWQSELASTVKSLLAGDIKPDPINELACKRCDFSRLCRYQGAL